jgi:ferredoxin-thioredoxin reductase catalytic chain
LITLEQARRRAESDARTNGCYLNPDQNFVRELLDGIVRNEERYGYPSCPCRLASGKLELDRDIICPCDYRDPDVLEYGCCYCALYVRKDVFEGKTSTQSIPERRPKEIQNRAYAISAEEPTSEPSGKVAPVVTVPQEEPSIKRKLWYCKQCGYVCFREEPPYICPVCKAKREMFSEIIINPESNHNR